MSLRNDESYGPTIIKPHPTRKNFFLLVKTVIKAGKIVRSLRASLYRFAKPGDVHEETDVTFFDPNDFIPKKLKKHG